MTKLVKVEGKKVDLKALYDRVKGMLLKDNFRITKDEETENAYHLKANKAGVTRIVIGAVRDVEVIVAGDPDIFAVVLIVGAWGKNIAFSTTTGYVVASAATGLGAAAGAVAAVGSFIMAKAFEDKLFEKILAEIEENSSKSN